MDQKTRIRANHIRQALRNRHGNNAIFLEILESLSDVALCEKADENHAQQIQYETQKKAAASA